MSVANFNKQHHQKKQKDVYYLFLLCGCSVPPACRPCGSVGAAAHSSRPRNGLVPLDPRASGRQALQGSQRKQQVWRYAASCPRTADRGVRVS
jgi:hypothetical protein